MNRETELQFVEAMNRASLSAHETAQEKGFNEAFEHVTVCGEHCVAVPIKRFHRMLTAERIALIHSELSEALEYERHGNPPDDKIDEFSGVEAELADAVIRIMHMTAARGWRLGDAIVAKSRFNKSRPFKHGKQF